MEVDIFENIIVIANVDRPCDLALIESRLPIHAQCRVFCILGKSCVSVSNEGVLIGHRVSNHFKRLFSILQVSVAHAGRSVQQDHWKGNTSRKLENSSRSANRISLTALEAMATMAAKEGLWITHSSTSKQTEESILRQPTRIKLRTNRADLKPATWETQTLVRYDEKAK